MRFGKRKESKSGPGRIFWGEPGGMANGLLEMDEREALLAQGSEHEEDAQEGKSSLAADPTQRLLTALGRFQRQVTKAEAGAPREEWTDDCIAQLITGIEIALENSWSNVQEALTDTARVLQSYEDAGVPEDSIHFLQDSYEILCLMVGDIIVDNVRSGVMTKWRQRYGRAVEELASAGIPLVDDEGRSQQTPAPKREIAAPLPLEQEQEAEDFEETVEELDESVSFAPWNESAEEASPFEEYVEEETEEEEALTVAPVLESKPAEQEWDFDVKDDASFGVEDEDEDDQAAEPQTLTAAADVAELEPEEELEELEEAIDEFELVEESAEELEEEIEVETTMEAEPDLFSVVEHEDEELDLPIQEENAVSAEPEILPETIAAPSPTLAEVAVVPEKDDSPEALMRTMQRAMASGNVTDAKAMALQLAAAMAQMEVQRAEESVRDAGARLYANADAIAAAEEAVRDAESRTRETEADIALREQEAADTRARIDLVRTDMTAVEEQMAALEAQIRDLQMRLDGEREKLAQLQVQLDEEAGAESRTQSDLEILSEAEQEHKERLEAARERVMALREERTAREAEVAEAEAELQGRRVSAEDIARTIQS